MSSCPKPLDHTSLVSRPTLAPSAIPSLYVTTHSQPCRLYAVEDERDAMICMLQRALRQSYVYTRRARREGAVWGFEQFVRSRKDDYSKEDYVAACREHGEALFDHLHSTYGQLQPNVHDEDYFLRDVAHEGPELLRRRLGDSHRNFSDVGPAPSFSDICQYLSTP